jgi:hypothetical protein
MPTIKVSWNGANASEAESWEIRDAMAFAISFDADDPAARAVQQTERPHGSAVGQPFHKTRVC